MSRLTTAQIRQKYLDYFTKHGHTVIPRANLVPQDDPTTLFTGSGMQPLVPYLLGQPHPDGTKLVDSQVCFRAEDIDEIGDNRHTTQFEMLGNWSLGEYFKAEQLGYFFEFLVDEVGLDPAKLYVTVFAGDEKAGISRDEEAAGIWQKLFASKKIEAGVVEIGSEARGGEVGMQEGRIFYYDAAKNWWSRAGKPADMPVGEPGGPDSEVFYDFGGKHNKEFGAHCHPNCDCGRFMEIGNSVFMQYRKRADGGFDELPKKNVDFGGGLERIAAAANGDPDVFKIDLIWPIIEKLEELTGKKYADHVEAKRVIADHARSSVFMAADGVVPSNTEQGYVMRKMIRRAIRRGHELGINAGLMAKITPVVIKSYGGFYKELEENRDLIINILTREEEQFRKTLKSGLRECEKRSKVKKEVFEIGGKYYEKPPANTKPLEMEVPKPINKKSVEVLVGSDIFYLSDTHGFPSELSLEEAQKNDVPVTEDWKESYGSSMLEQKKRSRTATKGLFKGGLADNSQIVTRYHTATHLIYRALKNVLGDHVTQRGSNITHERTRFDFSHPEKMTPEQIRAVEEMVNDAIKRDLPVSVTEIPTDKAFASGAIGAFGDKYGDTVKVYTVGDPKGEWYSREICGGPHVERTGEIGKFKIKKEESSSAGVRRIKAVLE